jgi:hypothetical protein
MYIWPPLFFRYRSTYSFFRFMTLDRDLEVWLIWCSNPFQSSNESSMLGQDRVGWSTYHLIPWMTKNTCRLYYDILLYYDIFVHLKNISWIYHAAYVSYLIETIPCFQPNIVIGGTVSPLMSALVYRSLKCMKLLIKASILWIIFPLLCLILLTLPSLPCLYVDINGDSTMNILLHNTFHRLVPMLMSGVPLWLLYCLLHREEAIPTSFGFCWRLEQILTFLMMYVFYIF